MGNTFCLRAVSVDLRVLQRWQKREFHVLDMLLRDSLCRHWEVMTEYAKTGRCDEDTCEGTCLQGDLDPFYGHGLLLSEAGYSAERCAGEELGDCH
ncbi:hypothetical protein AVEN_268175-1 [Araneus ventricosus]|uniref:Uncharacterized protein n=1 Tax=Araneus ventricosus TaxID=182803 RepID=A0A4Y2M7R9_ARAVE|nr:hypothetical protein AVEN_268175-1 [Araneus ventricosus]